MTPVHQGRTVLGFTMAGAVGTEVRVGARIAIVTGLSVRDGRHGALVVVLVARREQAATRAPTAGLGCASLADACGTNLADDAEHAVIAGFSVRG
jgi:hypothetical protein